MATEAQCGNTWRAWFAKWDHVSCSWRTPQCSFLEDLERFSETWPRSGLMLHGVCYPLPTLERRTLDLTSYGGRRLRIEPRIGYIACRLIDDDSGAVEDCAAIKTLLHRIADALPRTALHS